MSMFSARGLSTAPVSTVLDAGTYAVKIATCEAIVSQQKQTPGIKMDLVIQEGPVQANGRNAVGKHLFHTLWVSQSGEGREIGLQKLAKLCKICDVEQTDDLDLNEFIGKTIVVNVKQRMYNGELQENVGSYSRYNG